MRIGFFTTTFPYKKPFNDYTIDLDTYIPGGVGEVAYHLSLKIAQLGHEVYVFTTSADSKDYIERHGKITVCRYRKNFKIADTGISFKLLNGALKYDLDVVHLHLGSPPATIAALKYIKKKKTPFVVTHHLDPEWNYGNIIRKILVFIYAKFYVKKALSISCAVIVLSMYFQTASKFLGDCETKIEIIPNGINLDDFNVAYTKIEAREILDIPLDEKIILFVGSLTERKAPHVLLQSMPIILNDVPNAKLILVGSYTDYAKVLEKMAKHFNIVPKVEFTGFVNDATKILHYKSADVFVLPSFSESFGIVLLEAFACGLPSVVSDLEVFRAIIEENYNGFFTETGSETDLAEKIINLLKNDDLRNDMSSNAQNKVKDYSWDAIARKTECVYRRLLR